MPYISFIIPIYNLSLKLVSDCLRSILNLQLSEAEREIIIVDDGSSYSMEDELAAVFNDIVYIRSDENGGPSVARNKGIEAAHGEYVQFMDGDDYLISDIYNKCIFKAKDTDADVIMFDHNNIIGECEWQGPVSGVEFMMHNNLRSAVWGYLFKRSILGSLRFCPSIFHEDEDFTPQLIKRASSVYFTSAAAYFYRNRPNSITTNTDDTHLNKRLDDLEHVLFMLHSESGNMNGNEKMGMERRVAQLTMDYIFTIIRLKNNYKILCERLERLKGKGLFPLPKNDYTWSYIVFRILSNNVLGRRILFILVPLVSHKR